MEYRERHQLAQNNHNDIYIEADKALLRKYVPSSDLLHKDVEICETLAFELVFVLLDHVNIDIIKENRNSFKEIKKIEKLENNNPTSNDTPQKQKKSRKKKSSQKSNGMTSPKS